MWVTFFAAPIVKTLGYRVIFFVGSFSYTLYAGSFILPAYRSEYPDSDAWYLNKTFILVTIYLFAFLNGVGSSLLWVQLGNYISECATDLN